jgi:hypothetical protein
MENEIKFTVIESANNTYVQCVAQHENALGVISTKRGFIQVNPKKATALLEALKGGTATAKFGRPNRDGLCTMTIAIEGEESEDEADAESEESKTIVTAK